MEIVLRVRRSGRGSDGTRWDRFAVPIIDPQMTVLDALLWAQQNLDQTIAFRCACRVGMCGTCGMVVDGRESLACRTRFRDLAGGPQRARDFAIEPLRNLPVLRDLVCDLSGFYAKTERALVGIERRAGQEEIVSISPASRERRSISAQGDCIHCGLCYSACTVGGLDPDFLGPAALNRAFVALRDSRNAAGGEALAAIANEHGLWRCHSIYECTAVCPRGISPTLAIQALRRDAVRRQIGQMAQTGRTGQAGRTVKMGHLRKTLGFKRTKS